MKFKRYREEKGHGYVKLKMMTKFKEKGFQNRRILPMECKVFGFLAELLETLFDRVAAERKS